MRGRISFDRRQVLMDDWAVYLGDGAHGAG